MSSRVSPGEPFVALRVLMTEDCNLGCAFCHNEGQSGQDKFLSISTGEFERLVAVMVAHGLRQLKFSGGEPTLHPRLISFVRIALDAGLDTAVISNGLATNTLASVASAGARLCVNLPAARAAAYRRLTRGELAPVLRTLDQLHRLSAEVDLNSYARLTPDPQSMKDVLGLAARYSFGVKFLLPCQTSSVDRQLRARASYRQALADLDCRHVMDTVYDSRWTSTEVRVIRLVSPWCPGVCKAVAFHYRSLRLAADGTLRPCFGGSSQSVPVDFSSRASIRKAFHRALAATATECIEANGVSILRRRSWPSTFGESAHAA